MKKWPDIFSPQIYSRPWANYLRIAVAGGATGLAALLLFAISISHISVDYSFLKSTLLQLSVYSLLPAVTAFFVAYSFDETKDDIRTRWNETFRQGTVTGLAGFITTVIWLESAVGAKFPPTDMNRDYLVFTTMVTILIGGSLGYLLPHAHRKGRDARGFARIQALRELADGALGKNDADKWMDTPLVELDGMTPHDSARVGYGLDNVKRILVNKRKST